MSTPIQSTLTSDIQLALQHAVVEANNAFTHSNDDDLPVKRKKKRRREGDGNSTVEDGVKGRKKRKKRDAEQTAVESSVIHPDTRDNLPPKKKSRRDKGKQPVQSVVDLQTQDETPQVDPQLVPLSTANSQASTAAFLSAIVAAATATPELDPLQMQQHSQYDSDLISNPSQNQYLPYSPVQYYNAQNHFLQQPQQPQALFPAPVGHPFSELTFGSNEDVLRALQDLDISKITNVLKTLGEAAAAANVPFGQPSIPPSALHQVSPPPPLGQVPTSSNTILGIPPKQAHASENRKTIDMSLPPPGQHTSPDHAHLLATKWLNANKLAELVKTEGLTYKKGKFSAIEEQQLKDAIETYRTQKQLHEDQLHDIIFAKNEKSRDNAFWSEITAAVPQRPIIAVYHHVRRSLHPMKQQGKWMPSEDALLKQAVNDLGQQWEKVSARVGRMSSDCRDRYRNHIVNREIRTAGHWTQEEEKELTRIVTEMTVKQGKDIDNDVFWGRVSDLMGGKRGRQQCRIKWTDALSKMVKNEGRKPRWSQQDAYILVHKIDSLNVRDDTEIDWKTISDPQWNLWSAHVLQRRWSTMKKSVKGYEDMTHHEIMDILRVKKAQLPPVPAVSSRKRKERKVTSAAAIADSDLQKDVVQTEAGSSSGAGTLGYGVSMGTVAGESGQRHSQDKDADGSTDMEE